MANIDTIRLTIIIDSIETPTVCDIDTIVAHLHRRSHLHHCHRCCHGWVYARRATSLGRIPLPVITNLILRSAIVNPVVSQVLDGIG